MSNRFRLALILLCVVMIGVYLVDQDTQVTEAIPGAQVQLAFEENLENLGTARINGEVHDGEMVFSGGKTGSAHFAQGDGSWLEYSTQDRDIPGQVIEISFDFRAEDWKNPYKQGSVSKTMAVVSGRDPQKIRHLSFSLSPGDKPVLSVSIEDQNGAKDRLYTPAGALSFDWHQVKLEIDREQQTSKLYFDGEMVGSTDIIPSVAETGFDRIKLGTWHKKNQAYRGLIDNFVIRNVE